MQPILCLTPAIHLDSAQHLITRDTQSYWVSARTWQLLSYLIDHPHRILSDAELLQVGWPTESTHFPADLYRYISRIRQLVEPDPPHPHFLLTRRDIGYLWVGPSWCDIPHSATL